jgi:transcriptional regulator with XRE-family HTH domain
VGDSPIAGDLGHLGDRLARLRQLADVTQEGLAKRSGVSVDVIRKLEQHRKHSARLPTLHKLATGLGVEVTGLLGDPPALSKVEAESPALVAVRRAIMPSPLAVTPEPDGIDPRARALHYPRDRALPSNRRVSDQPRDHQRRADAGAAGQMGHPAGRSRSASTSCDRADPRHPS